MTGIATRDHTRNTMRGPRIRAVTIVIAGAWLACATAYGATAAGRFTLIHKSDLNVTEGTISSAGPHALLRTRDPAMRADLLDGGHHATAARLWFRYLGESTTTKPLGSGQIRRQIGLKLRSSDPCNLLYVMWHAYPDDAIEVQVKRNPGESTSSECGNHGYTTVATIQLRSGDGTGDHTAHRLEAHTRRTANGALALRVYTDGTLLRRFRLSHSLTAGLNGPIGIRSDNGDYLFRLKSAR